MHCLIHCLSPLAFLMTFYVIEGQNIDKEIWVFIVSQRLFILILLFAKQMI